jgi:beta-glucosidase
MSRFPERFVWGVATSAYQIEGAAHEDGRGESIWDRFARKPGAVRDRSNGDVACDHFHRFREDIELMRWLGLSAYRFSIAWPRVLPEGRGRVEPRGLAFYDRLVDALLEAGIEPLPTLHHWDLPQALEDDGGWPARATATAFADFVDVVSKALGDRVRRWITHNEPWCLSTLGYNRGLHAPGRKQPRAALAAAHHLLLSHGLAAAALRANGAAEVGISLNLCPVVAASESEADRDEARRIDGTLNRFYLDPLFGRGYPADVLAESGPLPELLPGDLEIIAAPLDFLGVNYYMRSVARSQRVPEESNAPRSVTLAPESEWTEMGWEVYPQGLHDLLLYIHREWAPQKLYVTENGASYGDAPGADGRVRDERRVRFLREHFDAAARAIADGVPLDGFFVWSLLDNFEWDRGYTQRFGIVWVDYDSQQRIPKDSAAFYREFIRSSR